MPKHRAITLASLALTLAALTPATALAKTGGTDRPLKSTGLGTTTLNVLTGEFSSEATEIISHVGKATSSNTGTLTVTGPGTFTATADFTIVASNGDELTGVLNGTGTFTAADSDATFITTITGGTGRFEGASGEATASIHGTTVFSDGVTNITRTESKSTGHITY
jgi:hypothetical protein